MRRLLVTALAVNGLAAGISLPAAPAAAQQWREVSCESWNYRDAACPVPGAVRVQLLRVNGGQCIEGQSWYYDGNAIRVRNGCRAVFRIDANNGWGVGGWDPNWNGGGYGGGYGQDRWQVVRCESWNYRDQRCAVGGAIGNVRLLRVIAGDCRDGATWRWDRRAIYVRNGCRADFQVLQGASGWGGGGPGGGWGGGWGGGGRPITSINCESWNYRPARCAVPNARSVRIAHVYGGNCVEGQSWGWSQGAIWVNGGCRARFDVY